MRPVIFHGVETEELAEYFTENLQNNDLSVSSRRLWGLYLTDNYQSEASDEWKPDVNQIFRAQNSEDHSYDWKRLEEHFEAFLENRVKEIENESYPEEIEQALNREPRETEFTSEQIYNLGYIETELSKERPSETSDAFMTSVACFYDEDKPEDYIANIEYLGSEEGLEAVEFLADQNPEAAEDLISKGFRRGQAEKALQAYRKIIDDSHVVLAQNVLKDIDDEDVAAQARSMLVENSASCFGNLKDIFDA